LVVSIKNKKFMFKKLILLTFIFLATISVFSPSVSHASDLTDRIKKIEYCGQKPYDDEDIALYYAQRIEGQKEVGSIDLYLQYFYSPCFEEREQEGKFKEMGQEIDHFREVEEKAGITRVDSKSKEADKRPIDATSFLSNIKYTEAVTGTFKILDPIADIITSIPNPFGSFDVKNFDLGKFLSDVVTPIRTPQFLKNKDVNLDPLINMTLIIFVAFLVVKVAYAMLKITQADNSEASKYETKGAIINDIITPFIWVIVGIKILGLAMVLFANVLLPTLYATSSSATSYNCTNKFEKGGDKIEYKDAICTYYKQQKSVCADSKTAPCLTRTGFVMSYANNMTKVSTKNLKDVGWVNTVKPMAFLNFYSSSIVFFIVVLFIVYNYFKLLKTVYDIFIDTLFVYIYALDKGSLRLYFEDLKTNLLSFVLNSVLITISMQMLVPLITKNWIENSLLIFIALGIPSIGGSILKKLGAMSETISATEAGMGKVAGQLSDMKQGTKKTAKRGIRLYNYFKKNK
jgi:hypothetical protein